MQRGFLVTGAGVLLVLFALGIFFVYPKFRAMSCESKMQTIVDTSRGFKIDVPSCWIESIDPSNPRNANFRPSDLQDGGEVQVVFTFINPAVTQQQLLVQTNGHANYVGISQFELSPITIAGADFARKETYKSTTYGSLLDPVIFHNDIYLLKNGAEIAVLGTDDSPNSSTLLQTIMQSFTLI